MIHAKNPAPHVENTFAPVAAIRIDGFRIASWIVAAVLLFLVMTLHLLAALLAGLLVYECVRLLTPFVQRRVTSQRAHLVVVLVLSALIVGLISSAVLGLVGFFHGTDGSRLPMLMGKAMEVVDNARGQVPNSLHRYLPDDVQDLRNTMMQWASRHSGTLRLAGSEVLKVVVHLVMGLVLGAMVALNAARARHSLPPLAAALLERAHWLADAFRRIVFAQIRISALNTILTGVFLLFVLPLAGVHLPLTKTLILLTFVVGLLPVIGNLISNAFIVGVALSVSLYVAFAALAFLVVIHKLEYFLNARIVGSRVNSRSWELLLSMLLMEAAFGMPGLIAAPIFYAYWKNEFHQVGWV